MASKLEQLVKDMGLGKTIAQNVSTGRSSGITNSDLNDGADSYFEDMAKKQKEESAKLLQLSKWKKDTSEKRENPQTPREEQIALRNASLTTKQKADNAKKAYDDYLASDEHKQALAEADRKYQRDRIMQQLTTGIIDMSDPTMGEDPTEKRLRDEMKAAEAAYQYEEQMRQMEEDQKVMEADLEELETWSEEDRQALALYVTNRNRDANQPLELQGAFGLQTAEQEASALIQKYGKQRVDEMAETYLRSENQKVAKEVTEKAQEGVDSGLLGKVGHNVATVAANLMSGLTGTMGYLQEMGQRTGRYSTLDSNNAGNLLNTYSGAVRGRTAEHIEGEDGKNGVLGKFGSIAYQGLMSAADSGARALTGGVGNVVLSATSSFSQAVSAASAQGATPAQAVTLGTVNAAVEGLSEKIPLDNLLDAAKGGRQNITQILTNALKQAGIEATTEEISLIGTTLAEAAILREKSGYNQQIQQLMADGVSFEEAKKQANKALLAEAANTAAVSAFSGGVSSAGASLVANKGAAQSQNGEAKRILDIFGKKKDAATMREEALNIEIPKAEATPTETNQQSQIAAKTVEQQQDEQTVTPATSAVGPSQQAQNTANAETSAISKPLDSYPTEKQNTIRSYIQSVDEGLKSFVQRVKNGDKAFKRQKISDVNDRAAADIGQILGIDASGYTHNINTGGVQHIINRHGVSGEHDNSMALDDDIARIGWVLDNYDSVELLTENGKQVYSREFKDGNNDPAPQIRFVKKIDGSYYVVEAACENKYKKLWVQSAYLQKNNGDVTQVSAESLSANHETNARSSLASPSPINNIPENGLEVNDNSSNSESAQQADTSGQSMESGQHTQEQAEQPQLQRDRVNSVREQAVPATDPQGKVVSEAAGNIYTSSRTSDSFAETIRRLVNEGRVSHDVQTNEESLRRAADSIAEDGSLQNALRSIREVADSGRTGALDVAKGVLIYDELVNSTDSTHQALAEECFVTLSQLATNTGRPMQLFSLFRKMTPESQVNALKNEVNRELKKLQERGTVKKEYQIQFDQELMDKYKEAAEAYQKAEGAKAEKAAEESMTQIQQAVYAWEAAKMPTTFKARWDAWRYMAMLGNVKTQARNFAGNASMMPYTAAKRTMGAVMEQAFIRDKSKRTKAVLNPANKSDSALLDWAKSDRGNNAVKKALENSTKLGDNAKNSDIADHLQTFGDSRIGRLANTLQEAIGNTVSAGDVIFKNHEYAVSLAGFIKARGYTAADIQNGQVDIDTLNEARNYAIDEALKATFNDANAISDFFTNNFLRRSDGDGKLDTAWNIVVDGILPFRKTPANVIARFKDYSPVGLLQGVSNAVVNLHSGKVTAATVIDQLSAGLTGTSAAVLGFALAGGFGGLTLKFGGEDEDGDGEDDSYLLELKGITGSGLTDDEKRQGHQEYALEFAINGQDYSYTIDWAAPANLPLFFGANYYKALENAGMDTDVSAFTSFIRGMGTMFEPMLSLSCLSSVSDLFDSVKYAMDNESIFTAVSQAVTSYFTQGIPALARQAAQATQKNKQTTFANSDDPTIRDLQRTAANIPFVGSEYQTDKISAWGEKESNGSLFERVVNSFVNPGTLKKVDNSELEQEITRLNEAGQSVTPATASKTISYTDKNGVDHNAVRLTKEQYETLATTQGQTAKEILETMFSSKDYAAMTDEQKAKAVDMAYLYARKTGEIAAIGKNHTGYSDSWMIGIKGREAKEIMRRVMNSELNSAMSDLDTAWDKGYDEETFSRELQTAYDSYNKLSTAAKNEVKEFATGTTAKYIEAREAGISHEDFLSAAENVARVRGTGKADEKTGVRAVRDIDRRQAIANAAGLSEDEVDIIMRCYMPDYDPEDDPPETTELKYDYIRQELGLSAEEYAATYRVYLDSEKKRGKIAAIRETLGCDYSTALALYNVYVGNSKKKLVKWYEGQ